MHHLEPVVVGDYQVVDGQYRLGVGLDPHHLKQVGRTLSASWPIRELMPLGRRVSSLTFNVLSNGLTRLRL